jgi:murein DD-endopeptidase MepM/ murein hydrolase activator NlpD
MSFSPRRHVTRQFSPTDQTVNGIVPSSPPPTEPLYPPVNTDQLSEPVTTRQLPARRSVITRQITMDGSVTTNRLPTLIRTSGRRTPRSPATPLPQRRRRIVLFSAILSSLVILTAATLFVTPLGQGQQQQGFTQVISNFFTSGSANSFTTDSHIATPTATQAVLTNEGYCGGRDIWGTCAGATTAGGVMGTGQMQRPISGAIITQPFANPEFQSWCGCWKPHSGIDLAAAYGTPVVAADSGQVIWVGWDWSGLGWAVKISHGNYIATIYGHLSRFIVTVGQNVNKGDTIAYEGSTGASTGPHLHFMILTNNIWVNPANFIALP